MDDDRGAVFLGDLAAAMNELRPESDEVVRAIGRLLGFEIEEAPPPEPPRVARRKLRRRPKWSVPERRQRPVEPSKGYLASTMVFQPADELQLPRVAVLPIAIDERDERPALEPLFEAKWTRAIVSEAVSTRAADGPVLVRRLIAALARQRVITAIPRRLVPSLRRGAFVLVDTAEGMVPFSRDAEWLAEQIEAVTGTDGVESFRFRHCPDRGVFRVRGRKTMAFAPLPGVPTVLLTDFGIARQPLAGETAEPEEWAAFLRKLRQARSPTVAFVPYPRERWPLAVRTLATIIEWDRRTAPAHVRTLIERARRL